MVILRGRRTRLLVALTSAVVVAAGGVAGRALLRTGTASADPTPTRTVTFADDFERANGPVGSGWRALRGSWSIASGAAVAAGDPDRILVRDPLTLGATFDASVTVALPAPAPATRAWSGLAVNVVEHGDGTQTYYALRVYQDASSGARAAWQLIRVNRSAPADATSLLAGGDVAASPGTVLTLRLETGTDLASLVVHLDGGGTTFSRTVALRAADLLAGGKAGLYSQTGTTPVRDIRVTTTTAPAGLSVADDFQRADGAVGTAWQALRGTWSIAGGAAVAAGDPERVLARDALFLGATFDASATVGLPSSAPTSRAWAGVAANIVDHGDGTQTYYALRVAADITGGSSVPWQLVRIDRSAGADATSLIDSGGVAAAPGTVLTVRLETGVGPDALVVHITGGAQPVEKTVVPRRTDRLTGGMVGLYSNAGTMPVRDFRLSATTGPAQVTFADDFQQAGTAPGAGWRAARGTWTVTGGVAAPSGPAERVLVATHVTLGSTYTVRGTVVLPAPAPSARQWTGLAVNLTDHGDGTQTYYAVRLGQSAADAADGNKVRWQAVKVTRSSSTVTTLAEGTFTARPGTAVRVTVDARNRGTGLALSFTGSGEPGGDGYVNLPFAGLLSGGSAGLYSQSQPLGVADFAARTSAVPADPPADPGPLACVPAAPGGYIVPGSGDTVTQVVDVDTTWAGHPVGQALLTTATDQYVGYYAADRTMTIAKRSLSSTTWTYRRLGSVLGWDSHNYLTMSLDSAGNLHVAGNMHAVPLVYFRTTSPGDISTLTRVATMVDPAREQHVTYPRFFTDAAGRLMFSYRDGVSGNGATLYDAYDTATRTWSAYFSTPLVDGEGSRSPYDTTPVLGPDGYWHVITVWRDTPDAGSSSMPSYMRSRDLLHWEDSAGRPIALPATYRTMDVIDPVPSYGGIVNGNVRLGFDTAGKVVVTYSKYDGNLGTQLYAGRPDGRGGWTVTQLTSWTGRWFIAGSGTLVFNVTLGGLSKLPDGNLRLDVTCNGAARTLVLDPVTLAPRYEVPTPSLPAEVTAVRSAFPGMTVQRTVTAAPGGGRHLLRWESLPSNNDLPRSTADTPPAQPLQIYLLKPAP